MPRGAHDRWGPQLRLCFSEKMGVTLHPLKIKRPKKTPKSRSQTRNCHLPSRPTRAPGPGGQSLEVKMTAGNRYCQETRWRPVGWPGHPLHPILPVTATHPIPRKLGAHSSSQAQTIQSHPCRGGGGISLSCGFDDLHLLPLFSSLQEWGCLALPPRLLSTVEIFIAGRKQIGEPRGIRSLVIPLGYYFPG